MIRVATNTSQVPDDIVASKFTVPPPTLTFHTKPAVDPPKSGDDTSVNTADVAFHVEYT